MIAHRHSHKSYRQATFSSLAAILLMLCLCATVNAEIKVQVFKGRITTFSKVLSSEPFPLIFMLSGTFPKIELHHFAMVIDKSGSMALYRWGQVNDPIGPFLKYATMKSQGATRYATLSETGLVEFPFTRGLYFSSTPPPKYWKRSFFRWQQGEMVFPFTITKSTGNVISFDAYSALTRDQLVKKNIRELLFGIAPKGELQVGNISNAYIVKLILK